MAQATQGVATPEIAIRLSLDRSGSRQKGQEAVVPGINGFIRRMQEDPSSKRTHITIGMWDSQGFDDLRRGMMHDVKPLEPGEFVPRALTPLYDAVVSDIEALERVDAKRKVLVIDSDGLENYSKRFPSPEAVKALIEAKRREGWVFIYLAANVDAWVQARAIGIPEATAMNYRQAPAERRTMWQRMLGTAVEHPYVTAMFAIAGFMFAVYAMRNADAPDEDVGKLRFSEEHRNAAMGVKDGWQEAVAQDVAAFNEPLPDIWALPDDLRDVQMNLPEDFDPAQGSMVDGVQVIPDPDVDILAPEEVLVNVGGLVVDRDDVESMTDRRPETGEFVEGERSPLDLDLSHTPAPAPEVVERTYIREPDPEPVVERETVRSPAPAPAHVADDPVEDRRDSGGGSEPDVADSGSTSDD
jgi:hypothetical protein